MSIHLHRTRQWAAWVLCATAMSPFSLCCLDLSIPEASPTSVTGRVTMAGRPVGNSLICIDSGATHAAFGRLEADGSFHLTTMNGIDPARLPGRYRAHLHCGGRARTLPSRFGDARTSGIELNVDPGWNDFQIDLH